MPPQQATQDPAAPIQSKVVRYNQSSFAGGEYSPICDARTDIDRYKIGLETCRNSIIHPHGGVSNRPGFRQIAKTKTQTMPSRMVKFIFSTSQVYYIEFGNFYCRFYTNRAQIQAAGVGAYGAGTAYVVGNFVTYGGNTYYCIQNGTGQQPDISPTYWTVQTAYEIPTPYAQADLNNLRFEESADNIYITHQSYPQQVLSRLGVANWTLTPYLASVIDGPFLNENTDINFTLTTNATTGTGVILTASKPLFNAGHIGALWRKTDYIQGQSTQHSSTGTDNSSSISCFTSWMLTTNGTWAGTVTLQMSEDGGNTWTQLQQFVSSSNFNVQTSNTESVTNHLVPFLLRVACVITSGTVQVNLSSLDFYQDGFVQITGYTDSQHVTCTVLQTLGSMVATPTWAEGAWSIYRGYPAVSRFYQDRLDFAGSPNNPDTNWFTVDGDYISYLINTPLQDSDGLSIDLTSRQLNAVNGLVAFQSLLVLTSSASWAISPISGSALTPTTVEQTVQEYHGSDGIEPVVIGNEAIYIQFHGKVVRSIVYQFAYNAFTSAEVNIFSRHLLEDWSVIDMCYQETPDNIVWFLRSDGQLLGMTYLKEQDVCAWHHHDTNGTFESITAGPGDGYDEVWVTVSRPNGRFVEVLEDRITEDVRQAFFVDNGVSNTPTVLAVTGATQANPVQVTVPSHGLSTGAICEFDSLVGMTQLNGQQYAITVIDGNNLTLQDSASGSNIDGTAFGAYVSGGNCVQCFYTFSGFPWLNGQSVSILGDGFVFPKQVVSGGSITLPRPCAYFSCGQQYLSDVETLPVELSFWFNPPPPMTTQGRRVKIGGVTFGFVDSRGGWIGSSQFDAYGNLKLREAFKPVRKSVNGVIELYTDDKRETLSGGYEPGGKVFYRQYDPLPFTIVRIIPEVEVGGVTSLARGADNGSASGVGTVTQS